MKEKTSEGAQLKPLVLPDAGLQPARCFAIIDLGSRLSFFNGQPTINKKTGKQMTQDRIMIFWELPKFMNVSDNPEYAPFPATVRQEYTYSVDSRASLCDVLKAWGPMKTRPEKLSNDLLKKFLGHPCMLNIEHNDVVDKTTKKTNTWANISGKGRGVNPWMKELTPPEKYNEQILFTLEGFTWDSFYKLPKYAQKLVRKSLEFPSIIAKNPEPIKADGQAEVAGLEEGDEIFTGDDEEKF